MTTSYNTPGSNQQTADFTQIINNQYAQELDIIDQIRQLSIRDGQNEFSLPKIAVIGNQSAGKSSLLRCCCGFDLPRGDSLTTRCPLQLCLRQSNFFSGEISYVDKQGESITKQINNKSQIADLVLQAQVDITEDQTTIVDQLISVTIKSQEIKVDLTLMDLPGYTQAASKNQLADTPQQIRNLVRSQIKDKGTIILLVLTAQDNVENSAGYEEIKLVDEKKQRTIGVFTKLDITEGHIRENVADFLNGQGQITLDRGYNAVVCHSHDDLLNNTSDEQVREKEAQFFQNNPCFDAVRDSCGVNNLLNKLAQLLKERIEEISPHLKERLLKLKSESEARLSKFPESYGDNDVDKSKFINSILDHLQNDMKDTRRYEIKNGKEQLSVASHISNILQSYQIKCQQAVLRITEESRQEQYEQVIRTHRGYNLTGMITIEMIEQFIKKASYVIQQHSTQLVEEMSINMNHFVDDVFGEHFANFTSLRKLRELFRQNLASALNEQKKFITKFISQTIESENYHAVEAVIFKEKLDQLNDQWKKENPLVVGNKEVEGMSKPMPNHEKLRLFVEAYLFEMQAVYPKIIASQCSFGFRNILENQSRQTMIRDKTSQVGDVLQMKDLCALLIVDVNSQNAEMKERETLEKLSRALLLADQI